MSQEKVDYIDTQSSGDSNQIKNKQLTKEVNNNEIDELSKEFGEMGCIVDAVKRPPNICVETCVYESESEKNEYSDEFEQDSDVEQKNDKVETSRIPVPTAIKLSKSQSSVCSNKPTMSMSDRSGRSTEFSSTSMSHPRRINMSFSNDRLREIERHNHILLTKIMSARNTRKSSIPRELAVKKPVPAASLARKNQQKQIDRDNMILLKKIQRAKSSALSIRR